MKDSFADSNLGDLEYAPKDSLQIGIFDQSEKNEKAADFITKTKALPLKN